MSHSFLLPQYQPQRDLPATNLTETYLARQSGSDGFAREVLLRCYRGWPKENPRAALVLADELRMSVQLSHSGLVRVLDAGTDDEGGYYQVDERVRGVTLQQLILDARAQSRLLTLEVAVNIAAQLLEALRYLHDYRDESGRALSLVHQGVAPANIQISREGQVKLGDYGIWRVERALRGAYRDRSVALPYQAPEALTTEEAADQRADLFALGQLLYELTVGQTLRPPGLEYAEAVKQAQRPLPPPTFARSGYPADLEIIVMRALEIEPDERYHSADEMLEALEHFAADTGLRLSHLRLTRALSTSARPSAAAAAILAASNDELDFDRQSMFVAPVPTDETAALAAVNEAIADLVPPGAEPATERTATASKPARESTMVVSEEQVEDEEDLATDLESDDLRLDRDSLFDQLVAPAEPGSVAPELPVSAELVAPDDLDEVADPSEPKVVGASSALVEALADLATLRPAGRIAVPRAQTDELEQVDGGRTAADELELSDIAGAMDPAARTSSDAMPSTGELQLELSDISIVDAAASADAGRIAQPVAQPPTSVFEDDEPTNEQAGQPTLTAPPSRG